MHPMEGILIPTSSQPPTNVPSTNDVLVEEDMEILQDVEYTEGEIRAMNFDQPFSEEALVVQYHDEQLDVHHTDHQHV
jgi:hypothetical protein